MSDQDQVARRQAMVDYQIRDRGVRSPAVLDAMLRVPREAFVLDELRDLAYDDSALPIAAGQTISQPYIVAMMVEALDLQGGERVLDVGTGSGYAAAVIACIAKKVYSIERIDELAQNAQKVLLAQGFSNIEVRIGDGSLGWPQAAPFDAIAVAAGAPIVPQALQQQLAIGGRLVLPVGVNDEGQTLLRITRVGADEFATEELAAVRFVPLIGKAGWDENDPQFIRDSGRRSLSPDDQRLVEQIAQVAEAFDAVDDLPLERLLERIGDSRLVLLGEASHGTSEFYQARQRITRALIEEQGFDFIAIEGDWPDVARMDHYVRHAEYSQSEWTAFARFPTWMWRNEDVRGFVDWLREHNAEREPSTRVAFYGLDLYSLFQSIDAVVEYLDKVDPQAAAFARERYNCLLPFKSDPANYGRETGSLGLVGCEPAVLDVLRYLETRQSEYAEQDNEQFLDALQNARLVVSAEAYYRLMYDDSYNVWNLRDTYMFDTLETLLAQHGEGSRAVVWAHNSHIGDARATERARYDELNMGQLCRERFGDGVYLIGFGTNSGTVAAASDWDAPMEIKTLRPVLAQSYEQLCHKTGLAGFLLPLGHNADSQVHEGLSKQRLQRAIGVIYRPETERGSHYFETQLPRQFDEYIWIEHSQAITKLASQKFEGLPDTYPFGL